MMDRQDIPKTVRANGDNDLKFRASTETEEQRKARLAQMGSLPMAESGSQDAGGATEYFTE